MKKIVKKLLKTNKNIQIFKKNYLIILRINQKNSKIHLIKVKVKVIFIIDKAKIVNHLIALCNKERFLNKHNKR